MDATIFAPREYHAGLKALGQVNWFVIQRQVREDGRGYTKCGIRPTVLDRQLQNLEPADRASIRRWLDDCERPDNLSGLYIINLLGHMLANGPKLFRPSQAQAEAMAYVSVDLFPADYQQPYPVTVVEMPRGFVQTHRTPKYVAVFRDPHNDYMCTLFGSAFDQKNGLNFTSYSDPNKKIEETLTLPAEDKKPELGSDFTPYQLAERVAINCCLLLTMYQTRLNPLDPDRMAKLAADAKSKSAEKRQRANRMMVGEFSELTLEQTIKFFDEERAGTQAGDGPAGAIKVKPHWRKGHWRRQPVGPRTERQRKLTFIRPVLVHGDQVADASQSSVTYLS